MDVDFPPILSVPEVARLLGCNRCTVYDMIKRDRLPGVRRVGRKIRVSRDAVLQWFMDAGPSH